MLSSLKARSKDSNDGKHHAETKSGVYIFTGHRTEFYKWEFRMMARYNCTKDEEKPQLGGKFWKDFVEMHTWLHKILD